MTNKAYLEIMTAVIVHNETKNLTDTEYRNLFEYNSNYPEFKIRIRRVANKIVHDGIEYMYESIDYTEFGENSFIDYVPVKFKNIVNKMYNDTLYRYYIDVIINPKF